MRLRTTMAPMVPQAIARFCSSAGTLRAASAITMALSPASMRSMTTIAARAEKKSSERISIPPILGAGPREHIENLDVDVEFRDVEWSHPFKGE